MSDLFAAPTPPTKKEKPKTPCQYCGKMLVNVKKHELTCKDNPYIEKTVHIIPDLSKDSILLKLKNYDGPNDRYKRLMKTMKGLTHNSRYTKCFIEDTVNFFFDEVL